MKTWWADTLFKRLFLLMWFGLVASHLLAFVVTMRVHAPPNAGAPGIERLPVLPSLPPMGAAPGGMERRGPPPDGPRTDPRTGPRDTPPPDDRAPGSTRDAAPSERPPGPAPNTAPGDDTSPGGLPATALWLDYGIRFLAIGVVAWFGARWLSAPMRRLAEASETLGRALGHGQRSSVLDERHGTLEVRQTAQVFNTMAQRLHAQFDAQTLLMAAISHDLRTPLARLRLRLETMDAQPQAARGIADVHEMDTLIGSALDLLRDRHAAGPRERVDLGALLRALVDDLAEQGAPAKVTTAPTEAGAVIALAPPAALKRVLGNLIGNALRHGGNARVALETRAGEACVVIDDDGPGIAAEQLDAVRQPFYRIDAARGGQDGGSGLGLYIAHDLAERHGGRVRLSNRSEGGLRAEFTLPLA